jgi:hypothetical protein
MSDSQASGQSGAGSGAPEPESELSSALPSSQIDHFINSMDDGDEAEEQGDSQGSQGRWPDDILKVTIDAWQACRVRDRRANRDDDNANLPKYNIRKFLRAFVQSGPSAKLLINALKDEAVREALEAQGVKVMDETESEPTQYIRSRFAVR